MIVRAIDGRFVGHPFFLSIEKERPWQRLSKASKHIQSEFFIHVCRAPPLSRCLCRAQALSVSGPGPAARCQGPAGPRRSLCRGPALFVSRPGAVSGPGALCVRARRSVSGSVLGPGGPLPALCVSLSSAVSVPGTLCVGPRRSLRQPPQRSLSLF